MSSTLMATWCRESRLAVLMENRSGKRRGDRADQQPAPSFYPVSRDGPRATQPPPACRPSPWGGHRSRLLEVAARRTTLLQVLLVILFRSPERLGRNDFGHN